MARYLYLFEVNDKDTGTNSIVDNDVYHRWTPPSSLLMEEFEFSKLSQKGEGSEFSHKKSEVSKIGGIVLKKRGYQ